MLQPAAATAVALGGVTVAQTASAQDFDTDHNWQFVDLSDPDVSSGAITLTNPTEYELRCMAETGDPKYVKPLFDAWAADGTNREDAGDAYSIAQFTWQRAQAKEGAYYANGVVRYLSQGETRELPINGGLHAGEGIFLMCSPEVGGNFGLFGYGEVQENMSIKSSVPQPSTTTSVAPSPTEIVTSEPSTSSAPTSISSEPTTPPNSEPTSAQPSPIETSKSAVPGEPDNAGSSTSVLWIVLAVLGVLGIGGALAFAAQNLNIPGLKF